MNNCNHEKKVNIVNEKLGIGMIAAALAVIILTLAAFLHQQKSADLDEIKHQGTGLIRLLGSMSISQLTNQGNSDSALRLLRETQVNQHFAYASVVDVNGVSLAAFTIPGMAVMPMAIPHQPSQWVGENKFQDNNGNTINEYFSPVMEQGELKAFVRLGYLEPEFTLNASQVRLLAILAMAIFLLAPIYYFMLKHEFKPLGMLGVQLQSLLSKTESVDTKIPVSRTMQEFIEGSSTAVEAAGKYIDSLQAKQTDSVVSSKLLIYQKTRMESAINALPFAILVADETGQVTYASSKIHQLLGTQHGEVLGSKLDDISKNRELSEFLVSCQAGNTVTLYQHDKADIYLPETDKNLLVSPYPLYSQKNKNQLLGTVIVFQDSVNESHDQKGSSEFIAHVAHELKSPLSVLYMYSELLLDNADNSRDLTINAANVIHDETGRLTEMIDNLLNLTMIEIGTVAINRQRIKVGEFLEDIYETMSRNELLATMDFKLNLPQDIGVLSIDKNLIRVAINNLVGNAIKYNRPDGKVELTAEESETDIIIRVRDTGIGISDKDQHHIFNKFFRSEDEETRKRSGHGLGLSLVREIVALHQGNIQLNSTQGEGSEFTLSFTKDSSMLKDVI